jgi:hypothetical protein
MVVEAGSGTNTPAKKVKGAGGGAGTGVGGNVRGSKRRKVEPEEEEVVEDAMEDDARMDVEDSLTKPEGSDPNQPPKRQVISCKSHPSCLHETEIPSDRR